MQRLQLNELLIVLIYAFSLENKLCTSVCLFVADELSNIDILQLQVT